MPSLNQLRRYQMTRQGLLERQPAAFMDEIGILHATDHATPYLSLAARIQDFDPETLVKKLQSGEFVRLECMRGTLHLLNRLQREIQCIYRSDENKESNLFRAYGIPLEEAQELRFYILEAIQLHGAQSPTSIKEFLDDTLIKQYSNKQGGKTTNVSAVMRWMYTLGQLSSGQNVKNWLSKDDRYDLLPAPLMCEDVESARQALIRLYFDLYAPASYGDWLWWTGQKVSDAKPAFEALQADLVPIQVEGIQEELWMFPQQAEDLRQTPDESPEMVRLLPYEDALLKAYKETRYRFFDDEGLAGDIAMTRFGEARPSLWYNGQIVGIWEWRKKANEPMTIEPFIQVTKPIRKAFKPEIDHIQGLVKASHVLWTE